MVEKIRDVSTLQVAIGLFCRVFKDVHLHSLHLEKYMYLKARAIVRENRDQGRGNKLSDEGSWKLVKLFLMLMIMR